MNKNRIVGTHLKRSEGKWFSQEALFAVTCLTGKLDRISRCPMPANFITLRYNKLVLFGVDSNVGFGTLSKKTYPKGYLGGEIRKAK